MNVKLSFDLKVYSVEAVLATAYWCADRIITDVSVSNAAIEVTLNGVGGRDIEKREIDEFKTMLIHNQIRHRLSVDFAPIERAIIEKAFSPVSA